jgi:hypothetical protein
MSAPATRSFTVWGDEALICLSLRSDAGGNVHGNTTYVVVSDLDLAGVQAGADFQYKRPQSVSVRGEISNYGNPANSRQRRSPMAIAGELIEAVSTPIYVHAC